MGLAPVQTQLKNELVHQKIGQKIFRKKKMEEMYVQKTCTKVTNKEYCSSDKSKNDPCWKIGDARRNIQQQKDRYVNNLK